MATALTSSAFWAATCERAARTIAQTLLATWGAGAFDVLHTSWAGALSLAAGAGLLSVLMSIAAGTAAPATGPSFGTEQPTTPTPERTGA